ncbi:molybdopterin molybdotransferase MoeA [Aquimarina sp. ERC-38]|uniref:molybdopterin molybdotransferase MoeA n=1 Tax=Aquimarina sp. ERC-38 TaxID=2949996 RepID=UPI002246B37F|nr:gephyrin-like molybdotransferase Glp [Aquimarina sp. ERC-38]UZO79249.1 molybdopterin molybdotransferase MoeA [Aquimarina sp. ERC-38]
MISIQEAYQFIKSNVSVTSKTLEILLTEATGYTLAKPVHSIIDMPPFRQSAMDGYALKLNNQTNYKIIGEVQAGSSLNPKLKPGEAVRIFTGAGVPDDADAIIIQEQVEVVGEEIRFQHNPKLGDHIRDTGEQIKTGEIAIQGGVKLTPAAIGFLQGLGVDKVTVYQKPNIAIITTGDELVTTDQILQRGQIYESNGLMLQEVLHQLHYQNTSIYKAIDTLEETRSTIREALDKYDIIIITGGISVGDYDHVKKAMELERITEVFYKVKQKPGKPLYFGKKEEKLIFALPGNPAAALSCFYVHVHQALEWFTGNTEFEVAKFLVRNKYHYIKKGDRPQFLKAFVDTTGVSILGSQSSAMLRSFAVTNCLAYLPQEVAEVQVDDTIHIILLPQL